MIDWDWKIPVNLVLGAPENIHFFERDSADFVGEIMPVESGFEVYVSSTEKLMVKRFTMAFMLAWIASDNNIGERIQIDRSMFLGTADKKYLDLQKCAMRYLMPNQALDFYILKKGVTNIDELSDIFGVSSAAMYARLKHLGIL